MLERYINLDSIYENFNNVKNRALELPNHIINFGYDLKNSILEGAYNLKNNISKSAFDYSCSVAKNFQSTINQKLPTSFDFFPSCSVKIIKKPIISTSKFDYLNDNIGKLLELRKLKLKVENEESKGLIIKIGGQKIKIDLMIKCSPSKEESKNDICESLTAQEKFQKEVDKLILEKVNDYFKSYIFENKQGLIESLGKHCSWFDKHQDSDLCMNLVQFYQILSPDLME